MSRFEIVFLASLCVAIAGGVLLVEAGPLATKWESGDGAAIGITDPSQRQGFQVMRALLLAAGAVGMGMAAWWWMAQRSSRRPAD
jgi:hypothetical protein